MSKLGYFIGGAIAGVVGVFAAAGIAVAREENKNKQCVGSNLNSNDYNDIDEETDNISASDFSQSENSFEDNNFKTAN